MTHSDFSACPDPGMVKRFRKEEVGEVIVTDVGGVLYRKRVGAFAQFRSQANLPSVSLTCL